MVPLAGAEINRSYCAAHVTGSLAVAAVLKKSHAPAFARATASPASAERNWRVRGTKHPNSKRQHPQKFQGPRFKRPVKLVGP
jgi:hypothetical protein